MEVGEGDAVLEEALPDRGQLLPDATVVGPDVVEHQDHDVRPSDAAADVSAMLLCARPAPSERDDLRDTAAADEETDRRP